MIFSGLGTQKMGFQDDGRVGGVISPCSFLEICPVVGEGNLGPKISQGLFFDIISRWWQLKHVFMFTPNLGEMIQFDEYSSDGLKPPTRYESYMFEHIVKVTNI